MLRLAFLLSVALALVAGNIATAQAASNSPTSRQEKQDLQREQRSLRGQLSSIRKDINKKQAALDKANSDLSTSERAISRSNRTLKRLSNRKSDLENRLSDLARQSQLVGLHVQDAEDIVSVITRAQFLNTMRQPWQTALEGGNPNEVVRMSGILSYLAREQARTLDRLENRQKNIAAVTEKTNAASAELAKVVKDEQDNRQQLEEDKKKREVAAASIKEQLNDQKERYQQLLKNQEQLSALINQIDRRIAEEAKKAAAARRQAQQQQRSQKSTASGSKEQPTFGTDKERTIVAPTTGNFGKLRGRLTMPTQGTIAARFGQRRSGAAANLIWRGLQIRAPMGQNVRACAAGVVVFSDWMRGFGNLIIIDHGSNYLSVYANNETLYKSTGEQVKQGETIATVGKSGGEDQPGLYFELRYKGKPFDPLPWLSR